MIGNFLVMRGLVRCSVWRRSRLLTLLEIDGYWGGNDVRNDEMVSSLSKRLFSLRSRVEEMC